MSERPELSDYVSLINAKLESLNTPVFELAELCVRADQDLTTSQKKEEFHPKLKMDEGTFSKYLKIGSTSHLTPLRAQLPVFFTTLYLVACLSESELKAGISEGVIHPSASRQAVQNWISLRKGKGTVANDNSLVFKILKPADYSDEEQAKLTEDIKVLIERSRCKLSDVSTQAREAAQKARNELIRSNTNAIIRREKHRRQEVEMCKAVSLRSDPWPFTPEQTKLTKHSSMDDCQAVLKLIGCEERWQQIISLANSDTFEAGKGRPASKSRKAKAA